MTGKVQNKQGMALILVLLSTIIILGAVFVVSQTVLSSKSQTDLTTQMHLAEEAAKSGIDLAVEHLWNQYVVGRGNTTGNLASYRSFLDDVVKKNQTKFLVNPDMPTVIDTETNSQVLSLSLRREDTLNGIQITAEAVGEAQGYRQRAVQTMLVSGAQFAGYEYAVLANYINCILCHASFYNIEERLNTSAAKYNTFDRIKLATLEALLFRPGGADSVVAGTIYTRGQVYNEAYQPINATTIKNSSMKHFEFSKTDGKLKQSATGTMTKSSLTQAGLDQNGNLEQFASLYTNYPTDAKQMTDGILPETFPAPFPDNNGNRHVDPDEFEEVAELLEGRLTGGIAYGVPDGGSYNSKNLPASSNSALADLSNTGRYDGNLILVGTDANPIVLNGEIAVNGDLILQGKVKGWGQFFVKGNTYLTGDVTYADAPGKFGEAADGTRNGLALVSGGNILMGDYLTVRGKNYSNDTAKFPDSSNSIQVRTRSLKKTKKINNKNETIDIGYFSPGVSDAGEVQAQMRNEQGKLVPRDGQQFSFTQSELKLFNNLELEKALADPNYRPRFYGLRDSQPNNVYVYTKISEEHAVRYDESGGTVKKVADRLVQLGKNPASVLNRASFQYMNPANNWVSEETLREFWWNDEMSRSRFSPWRFDGVLYSNNAIFAITRSDKRHGSNTEGKMLVRGAMICPDIGVLCAGTDATGNESFRLFYDPRVQEFWAPHDTTQVVFQRLVYKTESA